MLLRVNDLMMSIFEGDTSLRSRLDDTVESTVYGPYLSTKVKKSTEQILLGSENRRLCYICFITTPETTAE